MQNCAFSAPLASTPAAANAEYNATRISSKPTRKVVPGGGVGFPKRRDQGLETFFKGVGLDLTDLLAPSRDQSKKLNKKIVGKTAVKETKYDPVVQEKNQMVADTEQSAGSESVSMLSETQSCASSCQAIAPKPHPPSHQHHPDLPELTVTSISYEAL